MPDKRVLLLGATGTLGSHLAKVLPNKFLVVRPRPRGLDTSPGHDDMNWLSTSIDVANQASIYELVREAQPDMVVNCIAVTPGTPYAGDHRINILVNSLFPHVLAAASRNHGAHLIHISTDGVFSGRRGNYAEEDLPDPPDLYGRSKLLGEVTSENSLTIRTTFFGLSPKRDGLVDWLISNRGQTVKGFASYTFSGLSLTSLGRVLISIIESSAPVTGLYHVGGPPLSKYNLLRMLSDKLDLHARIEPATTPYIDRSLDSSRFWKAIEMDMPKLEIMIDEIQQQVADASTC